MKIKHPISLAIYLFTCFVLLRVAFMSVPWREGRTITYDPAGYYLPLPATFIYNDLSQFAFYDTVSVKYNIGDRQSHTFAVPNGNKTLKYSLGMAILYSPAFFVADAVAADWGFPRDGYSQPYYFLLSIWSIIVAFIGLFFLRKVLLVYFDDVTTSLTLFLLVFATNYLPYSAINNLMSHSFLFTLYALLIYCSWHWHQKPNWVASAGIGLTIGLLALSRPTEIIAVIVPVLFGCTNWTSIRENLTKFGQHWPKILTAAIVVALIGSIQLIYWKTYTGHWLYYSYQDQGFDFLNPHIWDGLFSFKKGWLIYTPLMIFGILGFRYLYRSATGLFLPFFLFFLINIYIVFSWAIWWYGGSVGCRAVIQSYAILCFPLAAFIQQVTRSTSRPVMIGFAVLALLLIDLNLMMTWQSTAPRGPWHSEYMTRKYYQKIIGKTLPARDAKKFLDINRELSNIGDKQVRTLLYHNFETDSLGLPVGNTERFAVSQKRSMQINGVLKHVSSEYLDLAALAPHPRGWIRASAKVIYTDMEWNEWRLARLKLHFIRNGQVVAAPSIRLQWLSDQWRWNDVHFEYPLRKAFQGGVQPGDQVQVIVENKDEGVPDIFVDDLKVELIEP